MQVRQCPFNRTKLECKSGQPRLTYGNTPPFNRTKLECKWRKVKE